MVLQTIILATVGFTVGAVAQAGAWQQCGGTNWSGTTTCVSGYHCEEVNPYYFQCLPGAASGPVTTTTSRSSTSTAGGVSSSTSRPSSSSTVGGGASATKSGTNPGSTLVSGWYWIRGVAAPNFHSYLQSKPTGSPSDAYLDKATSAGQFNVVSGQLVYNTGAGGELYMHVENPSDKTQRKLETWFAREKNDYGTFGFQGDTLTWRTSDISRPNEAAWLVCENQELFVNTGAYAYNTPAGCADQTIHYYNGATADV